jgi:1-hydroxycarotenoid 3,4-desaturase
MRTASAALPAPRVAVIGAGIAGLSAAIDLALEGARVVVLEREADAGGKMRELDVAGTRIDAGPTVLTLRPVFAELFAAAGADLDKYVPMARAEILARHAWNERDRLDLYGDWHRNVDAIGTFAGRREARNYARFVRDARRMYETLEHSYMSAQRPGLFELVRRVGIGHLPELLRIRPFQTLWRALGGYFRDPRLRQLFGRYSTYCGSSPFAAPATLMLIAHVEQEGVWLVRDGMHRIATALTELAQRHGVEFRFQTEAEAVLTKAGRLSGVQLSSGEFVPTDAVVVNADIGAIASGLLGEQIAHAVPASQIRRRSLSAITWAIVAETSGFPLVRHSVFFSHDYAAEFEQLFGRRQVPAAPTVYVCAQDRPAHDNSQRDGPERLLCLINAPPSGDSNSFGPAEIDQCEQRTFALLERYGLKVQRRREQTVVTTPAEFERLFPGTGGGLYGQATHGWRASFRRPGARAGIAGLYLAGGSVHPGPGVPMAALSGRLAAASLLEDLSSTGRFARRATRGGIWMP